MSQKNIFKKILDYFIHSKLDPKSNTSDYHKEFQHFIKIFTQIENVHAAQHGISEKELHEFKGRNYLFFKTSNQYYQLMHELMNTADLQSQYQQFQTLRSEDPFKKDGVDRDDISTFERFTQAITAENEAPHNRPPLHLPSLR